MGEPKCSGLTFINTTHLGEAREGRSIAAIRSHVSSRAQARKRKQQAVPAREALHHHVAVTSAIPPAVRQHGHNDDVDDGEASRTKSHARQTMELVSSAPLQPVSRQSQFLQPSRANANQGYARPLDNDERLLLDFCKLKETPSHYIFPVSAFSQLCPISTNTVYRLAQDLSHVLYTAYRYCHHKGRVANFPAVMQQKWLPFALARPSLMAGIFHVACRTMVADAGHMSLSQRCGWRKLQYRSDCLSMARAAIEEELLPSDTTIALALLLATESVRLDINFV